MLSYTNHFINVVNLTYSSIPAWAELGPAQSQLVSKNYQEPGYHVSRGTGHQTTLQHLLPTIIATDSLQIRSPRGELFILYRLHG